MSSQYTSIIATIVVILFWLMLIGQIIFVLHYWRMRRSETQRPIMPRPIVKDTRQGKLRQNGGKHTDQEWLDLCASYGDKCAACGKRRPLTKDHIVPVIKGGADSIDNIQPLCRACNSSKGTKTIKYNNRARHIASCPARLAQEA